MTFYPPSESKENEQLLQWTLRLKEAAKKHHNVTFSKAVWIKEFAKCLKTYGAEKLESVLSWYLQHMGEEFIPQAWNARAFYNKFDAIERAMQSTGLQDDQILLIHKERAKGFLLHLSFPIEIANALPMIIQLTSENWRKFWDRMYDRYLESGYRESGFLSNVIDNHPLSIFVYEWINGLSSSYDHYNGPITSLIFRPDSKRFKESFWRLWSYQWCNNAIAFDVLLDKLLEKKCAN